MTFRCITYLQAEIKQYAGSDIQGEYEKLYVHVSADTFEKVDAAVAVIELLVTSVSVSFNIILNFNKTLYYSLISHAFSHMIL